MDNVECTCNSRTCYACRRRQIDETALAIRDREIRICAGMTRFDVEAHAWKMATQWRDAQVNELALEALNW